jgi:diguanylate cyclase (GGDEF)-like protein
MSGQKRRRTDQRYSRLGSVAGRFAGLPLAILAVAFLAFDQRASLPAPAAGGFSMASYILALVGMALSAGFNRSRIFFALLLLAIVQAALSLPVPPGLERQMYDGGVYFFASLLLGFNFLVFSLLPERGLLTPGGRSRAVFLLLQFGVAAVVIMSQDRELADFIRRQSLSPLLSGHTQLPLLAAAAFGAAFVLLAWRQFRRASPVASAFFYALPALASALHFRGEALAQPLFFGAAAAMLTVAAIQDSYAIAYQDELTGLPSRRALSEELARLGDRYCVAMVDLDHFKKLNDTYGHAVGDDVLRLTAALISEGAEDGRAFRYGGEEFTIIFPERSAAEVGPILEALRSKIAQRSFFVRGQSKKRLTVSVSIGLAERGRQQATPEEVMKAADAALYRAKETGRNKVCT